LIGTRRETREVAGFDLGEVNAFEGENGAPGWRRFGRAEVKVRELVLETRDGLVDTREIAELGRLGARVAPTSTIGEDGGGLGRGQDRGSHFVECCSRYRQDGGYKD
jgi:hypothetical protein